MTLTREQVLQKYKIITSNPDTWPHCKTYPVEVQSKWAWKCAADVEYLANGYPEAVECIRVAKAYRDGLATYEVLREAMSRVPFITKTCFDAARQENWNLYITWLIEELYEYEKTHGTSDIVTATDLESAFQQGFNAAKALYNIK